MIGAQHQILVNGKRRKKLTSFGTQSQTFIDDLVRRNFLDFLSFEFNLPFSRRNHTDNGFKQGGLPCPITTQKSNEVSLCNLKRHVMDDLVLANHRGYIC